MDYDFRPQKFLIAIQNLEHVGHRMIYAIQNIREASGLSLKGFEHDGSMEFPHLAEMAILDIARDLGIVLGTSKIIGQPLSFGELDVSRD